MPAAALAFEVDVDPDIWMQSLRVSGVEMFQTSGVKAHGAVLAPDCFEWSDDRCYRTCREAG